MAFTTRTITHAFEGADGSAASGSVTFSLTKRMTNGTISVLPAEITANLDGTGNISQSLIANTDAGTIPADAQWRVDWRVTSASGSPVTETFWIVVPSGAGSIDLGTLLPQSGTGG